MRQSYQKEIGRNYQFDTIQVLRLIAALLVVITHTTFYNHERLDSALNVWYFGAIGVDIFFIISGFIMMATSGIAQNKPITSKDFLKKRIIRIVPMYWLATTIKVIALLLVPAMVLHSEFNFSKIFMSYFLLPQTNMEGRWEPLLGVGWTLLYEMFFYILFAIALFFKKNQFFIVSFLLLLCAFISLFRTPNWPAVTMYFHPIVLYFVIGMLFFNLNNYLNIFFKNILALIFIFIWFVSVFVFDIKITTQAAGISSFLFSIMFFWIFLIAEPYFHGKIPYVLLLLGEASYVLYLFHPLFLPIIPEFISRYLNIIPAWLSVLISIPIAFVISIFIHNIIEKPVTKWLRHKIL